MNMSKAKGHYNDITLHQFDPESGLLEVCPSCGAKPMMICKTPSGRKTRVHDERIVSRVKREEIMFDPTNYARIKRTRIVNRKKRETKRAADKYMIRGTQVSEKWLTGPKPKPYKYKKRKHK